MCITSPHLPQEAAGTGGSLPSPNKSRTKHLLSPVLTHLFIFCRPLLCTQRCRMYLAVFVKKRHRTVTMECKLIRENEVFTNWLYQRIYFCDCCWRYRGFNCKITGSLQRRVFTPHRGWWGLFRFKCFRISIGNDTAEIRARSYTLKPLEHQGLVFTIRILDVTCKCYSEEHSQ